MIIDVRNTASPISELNLGTHNGIFHCDEVVGIAILELAHHEMSMSVVRTRDTAELKKLDIVIDVGGGKYDHHMAGYNMCRPTGEKYASAGLVWRDFGEKVIRSIAEELGVNPGLATIQMLKYEIDQEIIIPVDLEDNGEKTESHMFSFISKFLPTYLEATPDYDGDFMRVETVVRQILKEIIKDKVILEAASGEIEDRWNKIDSGILEIPAQTMPWLEEVIRNNELSSCKAKFVIFPYPAGGWAAQCVPPSFERKFDQLVPFPKEWAGGNEETLPKISGIADATFCHNGRFFARAKNKKSVIEMCIMAMEVAEEE